VKTKPLLAEATHRVPSTKPSYIPSFLPSTMMVVAGTSKSTSIMSVYLSLTCGRPWNAPLSSTTSCLCLSHSIPHHHWTSRHHPLLRSPPRYYHWWWSPLLLPHSHGGTGRHGHHGGARGHCSEVSTTHGHCESTTCR